MNENEREVIGDITKSYKRGKRGRKKEREGERGRKKEKEGNWNNRFRLIIRSKKSSKFGIERNTSGISLFSMTISTLISTSISITITSNSTINLNLTLFEPHPTPPSHSPQTLHSPLSSPHTLSPHSIPLVTFNFTSITFYYKSKSP